jgi:trk system potassium uptake protein TrkA
MQQRILRLVGAHQVVNPEQEFGKRFANRLFYRHVIADTNLGEDLHLTEISIQPKMVGKTLIQLALPKRFGIMVVGIRRGDQAKVQPPTPDQPLQAEDHLILVGNETAIPSLIEAF